MKFIAILKDSLREAIDAKVFYVMVGLSLLLIGLAATTSFSPRPGGDMIAKMAAMPLSFDLSDLDPEEFQGGMVDDGEPKGKGRGKGRGGAMGVMKRLRGRWQVKEATPLNNAEDLPGSTFRVVVEPGATLPFFLSRPKPEQAIAEIKERFGRWDDVRLVEILDVSHEKGQYSIDFKLTEIGRRMWPQDFSLFFGALPIPIFSGTPLGFLLFGLETVLVNGIGAWIAVLISIVITAFFIPNMLRKGTVDMLIVKPMHRTTLLVYKYVGGLLFILINTTIAVGGVWLALSFRSGVWAPGFLISIPVITFFFAILYSVSTLFGVLTRSPIVSILMTLGAWLVLFVVGLTVTIFDSVEKAEEGPVRRNVSQLAGTAVAMPITPLEAACVLAAQTETLKPTEVTRYTFGKVARAVHFVLPRTRDLDTLTSSVLQRDLMMLPRGLRATAGSSPEMTWGESLTVSGVFIALMLGVSCWWFATKDY
jgi:ABC-type transport system involved in multi-copper enzyme maturation permease subunit